MIDKKAATAVCRILFAVAQRDRLRMLCLFQERGPHTVKDAAAAVGISEASASAHLRTLRCAGLLAAVRQGIYVHYGLNPRAFDGADLKVGPYTFKLTESHTPA